jgi:flagellar biosynthetic protein FliP
MVIVLALLRQALGTQQVPPSQVIVGLAMFLTVLGMMPTWDRINSRALKPYFDGTLAQMDALTIANDELREFMFRQIEAAGNEEDVYLMHEYATQSAVGLEATLDKSEVSTAALIPAFMISELKSAFAVGFRLYLPFLVIDMAIATILVSMGMMMLPPVLVSLPFKLLLFVMVDGWRLAAGALMTSIA